MASIFYQPAIEILKSAGGGRLGAGAIKNRIISDYPNVRWSGYQGPVRAMLLAAAANPDSPIRQVEGSAPPLFYYEEVASGVPPSSDAVGVTIEEIADNARRELADALRQEIRERLYRLTWQAFEDLVVEVITKAVSGTGEGTQRSHDHGIDGFVTLPQDPFGLSQIRVQAKHHKTPQGKVNEREATHFIGALDGNDGIIVTNTKFAPSAIRKIDACRASRLVRIDGDRLVDLMIRFGIGLKRIGEPIVPMHIDEDFLGELGD